MGAVKAENLTLDEIERLADLGAFGAKEYLERLAKFRPHVREYAERLPK